MTKGVARVLHGIRAELREKFLETAETRLQTLSPSHSRASGSSPAALQVPWLSGTKRHRRVPVRPCAPRLRACLASAVVPVIDAGGCEWV